MAPGELPQSGALKISFACPPRKPAHRRCEGSALPPAGSLWTENSLGFSCLGIFWKMHTSKLVLFPFAKRIVRQLGFQTFGGGPCQSDVGQGLGSRDSVLKCRGLGFAPGYSDSGGPGPGGGKDSYGDCDNSEARKPHGVCSRLTGPGCRP